MFFDRIVDNPDLNAVELDDFQGGYQSTKHLLEQGCRRIAHFGGPQHLQIYINRFGGYRAGAPGVRPRRSRTSW